MSDSQKTLPPAFKPLHGVCEFLNAVHIYADEARKGETRAVESHHFCSHVGKELRQCLIYDSGREGARLIGVEYMIPKHVFETLDAQEQKLWHSHEFEVLSGMLAMPKPEAEIDSDEWEAKETEAMREVAGLYGKTWHFWQVDRGDALPLGVPTLMGSLTNDKQTDLDKTLASRNEEYGINHKDKAAVRSKAGVKGPGVHPNADSWWKDAEGK